MCGVVSSLLQQVFVNADTLWAFMEACGVLELISGRLGLLQEESRCVLVFVYFLTVFDKHSPEGSPLILGRPASFCELWWDAPYETIPASLWRGQER